MLINNLEYICRHPFLSFFFLHNYQNQILLDKHGMFAIGSIEKLYHFLPFQLLYNYGQVYVVVFFMLKSVNSSVFFCIFFSLHFDVENTALRGPNFIYTYNLVLF